jgi:hypothetical protein
VFTNLGEDINHSSSTKVPQTPLYRKAILLCEGLLSKENLTGVCFREKETSLKAIDISPCVKKSKVWLFVLKRLSRII